MIVIPKETEAQSELRNVQTPVASSSSNILVTESLPSPTISASSPLLGQNSLNNNEFPPAPSGPPPGFTPYSAEFFETGCEDIVSHDPHLNTDGEALYRFLLSQAATPPSYRIQCKGTHDETRHRRVTERDANGRTRQKSESYTETITDFDFCISIRPPPNHISQPVYWTVGDDDPAYRGRMVREVETTLPYLTHEKGRRKAKRKDVNAYKDWEKKRNAMGLPPWVMEADVIAAVEGLGAPREDGLRSSKTIRDWADEYCASPKYLKEFVFEKVIYGWNIQKLQDAIRSTIESTPYSGDVSIEIRPYNSKVYIRPDNKISRWLSNKWLMFLSIILFIFPFIWLYKRFHSRGGGTWEVCGAAYALKKWVPLEPGEQMESPEDLPPYEALRSPDSAFSSGSRSPQRSSYYIQTPTGTKKLIGQREGEWFRAWEGNIRNAVLTRYQSQEPLTGSHFVPLPVRSLDGYDASQSLIQF
ncbi:hypothetical protein CVT24_005181 [Panaeolus cyanescens]|uniref:Uncharacterized protein n=1 Tax=Panaeolus cyanescens TaxID=181874 RepID=A0A409Y8Y8_9AGAR|nr:hypothetical protein CVT24_005181 [Panaeolus cyanescens]